MLLNGLRATKWCQGPECAAVNREKQMNTFTLEVARVTANNIEGNTSRHEHKMQVDASDEYIVEALGQVIAQQMESSTVPYSDDDDRVYYSVSVEETNK